MSSAFSVSPLQLPACGKGAEAGCPLPSDNFFKCCCLADQFGRVTKLQSSFGEAIGGAGAKVGLTLLSILTHSFDSRIRYIFQLFLVLP